MAIPDTITNSRTGRAITTALACAAIIACVYTTKKHVTYWHNSVTLFERAIAVTKDNYVAHNHLGAAYSDIDRYNEAYIHYTKALQINYIYLSAHVNFGNLLIKLNRMEEAIESYNRAININPSYAPAYHGIGVALMLQKKTQEAIPYFKMAVTLNPNLVQARENLQRAMNKAMSEDNASSIMMFIPR
jgi:tetratricopeptide (TPR) repeat protein